MFTRMGSRMVLLTAAVAALAFAAAGGAKTTALAPAASAHDVHVFTTPGPPLVNGVLRTFRGERANGTCIWHPPELTLQPGQRAVEARQVSADYTACTTVVEVGTPADAVSNGAEVVGTEAHGTASSIGARGGADAARAPRRAAAYYTSQAWYRVTWYDIVNLELNHTRSILAWTWGNNQCIVGSTHSWGTFAQGGSGWSLSSLNHWKDAYCDSHYGHVDADFSNYIFCVPPTYVHYRDVRIRGGYQGGYGGSVGSTWADGACLPLHWSARLQKDW